MIYFLLNLLLLVWLVRTVKYVLFWLYLWQLKDYHIHRFLDHFRTDKGRKLLSGMAPRILFFVVFLREYIVGGIFGNLFFGTLLLVYSVEAAAFLFAIMRRRAKGPVFTKKMWLLSVLSMVIVAWFGTVARQSAPVQSKYALALLAFDLLVPIIVTVIVLCLQPLFVAGRLATLKKAAQKIKRLPKLTIIGITGSYGKTSTKEFLTTILSAKYRVLATPEHRNSEMGIAKTILEDVTPEHEIFIVEMGAYRKGGIKLLCDMVRPHIGVVTGVNEQHLALFGSLDNLLSAEGGRELAQALPEDGVLIVNGENNFCVDLYKTFTGKKKIYATTKTKIEADMWAEEVVMEKEEISFLVQNWQKELAHVAVSVLGKQQVQNLLGAMLVAKEFDMTLGEITAAAKNITQQQGGMTTSTGIHGIQVIDSSYSSNPDGVMADLEYLKIFNGKKVVAMPCLIELGAKSAAVHYQIGKKIAQICDLAIVTTRDQFEQIKKGATENGMNPGSIIFSEKPKEIFSAITTFCKEGDAVLLEGRVPSEVIKLLKL